MDSDSDSEYETPSEEDANPLRVIDPSILEELKYLDLSSRTVFTGRRLAGSGAYGDVWKGRCVVSGRGKVAVAIKRLRFHLSDDIKLLFEKEIYVWAKLRHANILSLLGYAFDPGTGYPLLVSEWMKKGSAWAFVLSHPDCDIMRIVTGIAQGLAYLHEKGVVHSDMKSDNVLVTDSEDAVICDFGCSRMINSSRTLANLTTGLKGTARYLAYELLNSFDQYSGHSKVTDVWAFGMTVFELLARQRPFAGLSEGQVISRIIKLELPSFPENTASPTSSETKLCLWDICQRCWKSDPRQREDMASIVRRLSMTAKVMTLEHLEYSDIDVLQSVPVSSAALHTSQPNIEPHPSEEKAEEFMIESLSLDEEAARALALLNLRNTFLDSIDSQDFLWEDQGHTDIMNSAGQWVQSDPPSDSNWERQSEKQHNTALVRAMLTLRTRLKVLSPSQYVRKHIGRSHYPKDSSVIPKQHLNG